MSRETERQKNRLRRLADFIEASPSEYDQAEPWNCIVGLGARLRLQGNKAFLIPDREWDVKEIFEKRYGVDSNTVGHIWGGRFGRVVKGMGNYSQDGRQPKASTAARLVRFLAEGK